MKRSRILPRRGEPGDRGEEGGTVTHLLAEDAAHGSSTCRQNVVTLHAWRPWLTNHAGRTV